MVVESTGGDVVSCTGCIYTSGNRETAKQCGRRRRPWYDILNSIASCLGRIVGCKGWLIHSIKLRGHGNRESTMTQCRHRPWSDLPNDILISIASRLGRVECIRFMNVCKGWLHSIKHHPPRGGGGHRNHLKPCLLVMEQENTGWVSINTPFPSKTYKLKIPELKETFFRFSKDGWILLSKASPVNPRLFLFNMLTGTKFDLPDLGNHPTGYCGMCFTSTPGSSDFMVVMIRSVSVERVTIFTYRPSSTTTCTDDLSKEEEKWTEECYENSSRTSFLGVSCSPVFYKKKFYCLDRFGHLGVFDHVHKNWTTFGDRPKYFVVNPPPPEYSNYMLHKMPPAFHNFSYKSFMVDLEGEDLISVFVSKTKTEEVHIFRLEDCCKMGWEKVDSLGMGELFVGLQTSISTTQAPYGSWNNIYFTGLRSNNYGEVYSLETKAYDPSCSSFWRDPLKFTWIELPISKWESTFYSKWRRSDLVHDIYSSTLD